MQGRAAEVSSHRQGAQWRASCRPIAKNHRAFRDGCAWLAALHHVPSRAMGLEGKWNFVVYTPLGEHTVQAKITRRANGDYAGTLSRDKSIMPIVCARLDGNEARIVVSFVTSMGELTQTYHAVVKGEKMFGLCRSAFGSSDFSGRRVLKK